MTIQLTAIENDFTCGGQTYTSLLTKGVSYLSDAIRLARIMSSPGGAQLYALIELQPGTPQSKEGLRLLGPSEIRQVIDVLLAIEQDLGAVIDEDEIVRPTWLARLQAQAPDLLSSRPGLTGPLYTLSNVLMSIIHTRHFFEGALCIHSDVEISY